MGKQPGEGAEERRAGPRSSFEPPVRPDEALGRVEKRPAPAEIRRRALSRYPDREACRPAGLLASGSSAAGLLPGRATGFPIGRVQWFLPGASPVTVAGAARDFHPLPLAGRIKERRRARDDTPSRARRFNRPHGYDPAQDARSRLHARLRPPAPRRFPGGRARARARRPSRSRDLPAALPRPRRARHAALRPSAGRRSRASPLPGPRRLRPALGHAAPLRRQADAARRGHRRDRDGGHDGHRRRRGGAPHARVPGRLLDARARRRRGGAPAPALPPRGDRARRRRHRRRGHGGVALLGHRRPRRPAAHRRADLPRLRRRLRRPRVASLRRQLVRQRGHGGQHRLRLRRRDGGVPDSFGRTSPMGSKGKRASHTARRIRPRPRRSASTAGARKRSSAGRRRR